MIAQSEEAFSILQREQERSMLSISVSNMYGRPTRHFGQLKTDFLDRVLPKELLDRAARENEHVSDKRLPDLTRFFREQLYFGTGAPGAAIFSQAKVDALNALKPPFMLSLLSPHAPEPQIGVDEPAYPVGFLLHNRSLLVLAQDGPVIVSPREHSLHQPATFVYKGLPFWAFFV